MLWEPYSKTPLALEKVARQPGMIDFAAAWCGPYQIMESRVFGRKNVVQAAERFVKIRADKFEQGLAAVQ
ncbi:MAG: hypothetical protein M2R45_03791 [Verrucomicrobia subdivision 3 bacterium]|nr:hypothetical protein [Limisphaerales bacterium]MCS1416768.1 hypothetical protein [Limisphaerales bacterium]